MRYKAMLFSLVPLIIGLLLVSCESIPVPPVNTAKNMAKLIEKDMTLTQVYDLMDTGLRDTTTLHPAQDIEKQADGSWIFTSEEDGFAEDEEAPFHVLIFTPDPVGGDYYMVFFGNESVIENDWFIYSHAVTIRILDGSFIQG